MTREVVAVRDEQGFSWFAVEDAAQSWSGTTLSGGELFHVAGRWVRLDSTAGIPTANVARVIDDDLALEWLVTNNYRPPTELSDLAERHRLR